MPIALLFTRFRAASSSCRGPHSEAIYFVRRSDSAESELVIASNYFSDGYAYLLNAAPGRYAVVAAGFVTRPGGSVKQSVDPMSSSLQESKEWLDLDDTTTVYAPHAFLEETTASVGPGEVVFLGEAVLAGRGSWSTSDETERRYLHTLDPEYTFDLLAAREFIGPFPSTESELDRSDAVTRRFTDRTHARLVGTGWEGLIRDFLAAHSAR